MTSNIKTIKPVTYSIAISQTYDLWRGENSNDPPHRRLTIGFDMVGNPLHNGKVLGQLEIESMPLYPQDFPYLGIAWTGDHQLDCLILYETPDKVEAIKAALDLTQTQKFELSLLWQEEDNNWAITRLKFGDVAFS